MPTFDPQPAGVCLIEDDPIMGESLHRFFELEEVPCDWHHSLGEGRRALTERNYCALISDIRLPDGNGAEFYSDSADSGIELPPTLFITGYGSIDQAVQLLKRGARDYITKPFELDELLVKLRRICPALFEQQIPSANRLGISPAMQRVEQILEQLSGYDLPVLITGESGVGKEYAARYLHACRHPDSEAPFVALNCAAIPSDLIEAELFGVVQGAFTGATSRPGLFEQAEGGTLFLDEVGEMPLDMQAKLLRAVQEQRVRRVGGRSDIEVNCTVLWATHRDLQQMVEQQAFREDLYFRISGVQVEIPPLRERREDIQWFARRFLEIFSRKSQRRVILSRAAENHLAQCDWPGNIRQLRQAVERAAIFNRSGVLEPADFAPGSLSIPSCPWSPRPLRDYLQECERWYINEVLERNAGKVGESATQLGISRKNLWERMQRLGISNSRH